MFTPAVLIFIASLAGTIASMAAPQEFPNCPKWVWKWLFWISFPIFLISIIFLGYENFIMPNIQEIKRLLPIILVIFGIVGGFLSLVSFSIGAIWFYSQQSKSIALMRGQNTDLEAQVNQYKNLTNRNRLLRIKLPDVEALKAQYGGHALAIINSYLPPYPPRSKHTEIDRTLMEINRISKELYGDFLKFNNPREHFDINKPFEEEDQIPPRESKDGYRYEKYTYLSNINNIDGLIKRMRDEIKENEILFDKQKKAVDSSSH